MCTGNDKNRTIIQTIDHYIDSGEIAGAGLIIRKGGREALHYNAGYANVEKGMPVKDNTLFRLASMTKPITAIAAMQLIEQGKLDLEAAVADYLPEFAHMQVADKVVGFELFYAADPDNPMMAKMIQETLDGIHLLPAVKPITIMDLLNHSSGLGMGLVSRQPVENCFASTDKLKDRVEKFARTPLDFEPGTMTGYSAVVGFDVLGRIIEKVTEMDLHSYMKKYIMEPLDITDITYVPSQEQKGRLARLYEYAKGALVDVTECEPAWQQVNPEVNGYYSGSAGLFGTLADYDKIVQMLANKGTLHGRQILKMDTIKQMTGVRAHHKKEFLPDSYWGLGMVVFGDHEKTNRGLARGSYGWSGAYGSHFYIDPVNQLTVTLMAQRSNIGGAFSPVSHALETAVYKTYIQEEQ